jgi:hypothetical protein
MERTRLVLEKVRRWTKQLGERECLFLSSWKQPESFDAQNALQWLKAIPPELLQIAELTRAALTNPQTPNNPQDVKLLIAAFGRYAYGKENYLKGLVEHARIFALESTYREYSAQLPAATRDIETAHALLTSFKNTATSADGFLATLFEECLFLPGIFRTQAHDIDQLVARFDGEFTFDRAGFTVNEALEWQTAGYAPYQAGYWRAHYMNAKEAQAWEGVGITNPQEAFHWKVRGFDSAAAKTWMDAGYATPEQALAKQRSGGNPS